MAGFLFGFYGLKHPRLSVAAELIKNHKLVFRLGAS